MELKKYSKENHISYCFGAFPTYELLQKKPNSIRAIILHEKLEMSDEILEMFDYFILKEDIKIKNR